MKNRTQATADRTKNPVQPQPGAPGVTVIPPMKPFQVRETITEGDKDSFGDTDV